MEGGIFSYEEEGSDKKEDLQPEEKKVDSQIEEKDKEKEKDQEIKKNKKSKSNQVIDELTSLRKKNQ